MASRAGQPRRRTSTSTGSPASWRRRAQSRRSPSSSRSRSSPSTRSTRRCEDGHRRAHGGTGRGAGRRRQRRVVVSTIAYAILGALIAVVVVLIGVDRTDLVLDAYLVYAGGLVALAASRIARAAAFPSPRGTVPAVLALAQAVRASRVARSDGRRRRARAGGQVRPSLPPAAGAPRDRAAGLAAQSGIELDRQPDRARERLSPATWELVRPDRPRPERAPSETLTGRHRHRPLSARSSPSLKESSRRDRCLRRPGALRPHPRRRRAGGRRQAGGARARAARHARRRPRPHRGLPRLAKTLLARSFAAVTDLRFSRIQFTPDLMPSDVTGSSIYNQRTAEFDFRPGPSSRTSCSATRSTARRRRPRLRCSRRCRSVR